jgi:hypothetical protein
MADIIEGIFGPLVQNTLGEDIRQANLKLVQAITEDVVSDITKVSGMSDKAAIEGMLSVLVDMHAAINGPLDTNVLLLDLLEDTVP